MNNHSPPINTGGLASIIVVPRNASALLLLLFTGSCIYIATICIYRIFLHPFAHIPGPLLAKLTDAYGLYHAWRQDTHLIIYQLHLKHGAIVRYGPNRILVNDVQGMKEIYGYNANFAKGKAYEVVRATPVPSVFNVIDKNAHRRKRRLVAQGFSEAAMRASEGCVLSHVDHFVNVLLEDEHGNAVSDGGWGSPKDVSIHSGHLALDTITDLVYGKSTDTLTKPDHRHYRHMILSFGRRIAMALQMPVAFRPGPSGQWLDLSTWTLSNMNHQRAQWSEMIRGWTMDRIVAENARNSRSSLTGDDHDHLRRDMMSTIINATDPDTNEKLSHQEIGAEASTLITAGADTTATAISATLFYLSRNRSSYDRLVAEIRSQFPSLDEVHSGPVLNGCQYLRACIDEALRIAAPVIAPLYRQAGPGGATVCGVYVPEGLVAATQTYALHHNDKYFPEPYSYRPERWLPASPDSKAAFFAFSHGSRNCVGINLAYLETSLAIARLLWVADLRIPADPTLAKIGGGHSNDQEPLRRREDELQLYDIFTGDKNGPMLEFRRR